MSKRFIFLVGTGIVLLVTSFVWVGDAISDYLMFADQPLSEEIFFPGPHKALVRGIGAFLVGGLTFGICLLMSRLKEAHLATSRMDARFQLIADNVEELLWMVSPDYEKIYYINPAHEKILGRSREKLKEKPTDWLNSVHPEDREGLREAILEDRYLGELNETYRIQAEGSTRWIHTRAFPVRDAAGKVTAITGIGADVTDRERKLASVRELADQVFSTIDVIVAVMNPETKEIVYGGKFAVEPISVTDLTTQQLNGLVAAGISIGTLYCFLGYRTLNILTL